VRREGALHQRVQVPPEELSMHLGSYRARSRYQSDRGSRIGDTPEQFGATIKADVEKFSRLIKNAGIKAEL
jgi:hypothetical protein